MTNREMYLCLLVEVGHDNPARVRIQGVLVELRGRVAVEANCDEQTVQDDAEFDAMQIRRMKESMKESIKRNLGII